MKRTTPRPNPIPPVLLATIIGLVGTVACTSTGNDGTEADAADATSTDTGEIGTDGRTDATSPVTDLGENDATDLDLELPPVALVDPNGAAACVGRTDAVAVEQRDFAHLTTELTVAIADPEHSAQDVITTPALPVDVVGKFAYGRLSKDLEDEEIAVFLDDCTGWSALGSATTDGDGRTALTVDPVGLGLGTGRHALRQVVRGDLSAVDSTLSVYPAGTRLVVLDIDGTLTTGDSEVFQDAIDEYFLPIYVGDYAPEAYPDAQALTWALYEKGYAVVYLTGRPYWLTRITRDWLASEGFAPGHLHVTDTESEVLPTETGVQAFKGGYLQQLQAMGFVVDAAFGNATTDIGAYAAAGVPGERTWIIGDNGGLAGTVGVAEGWTEVVLEVDAWPEVVQPF